MGFPQPVPIDNTVREARRARKEAIMRVAFIGILVRLLIVLLELSGYFIFDSLTLLFDSLATLADVISSLVLVVSIRLADRPPDENHPFGHGRYEPIAGLQLGIFLCIAGGGLFFQQVSQLVFSSAAHAVNSSGWIFALIAVVLLECSYRRMTRVAKEQNSQALLAEALHFRADSLSSSFALISLLLAAIFPHISGIFDRLGAMAISLTMLSMGLFGAKKNLNQLLDRIPEGDLFEKVRQAAMKVQGVLGTEKIRIQQYGPDAHVDIDIEVNPELSVEVAHEISQHVRAKIQIEWPQVQDVTVHIEPYYAGDH